MKKKKKLNKSQTKKEDDRFFAKACASWVPKVIGSKRSSTLDDIYLALLLSIKNILNELRTTTNDLIEYNKDDEIVLWKKGNAMMDYKKQEKIDDDWKMFEEEIKSWTNLLKLKIRRYKDLKHETIVKEANQNKWIFATGPFSEHLLWLIETLKEDKKQCKEQLKEIQEDFRLMEAGEATKHEKTETSVEGFLQKEENQMNNILLEKQSVLDLICFAFDKEIFSPMNHLYCGGNVDYHPCGHKIESNRKSADKKRSQVCRPEELDDRKPAAKKR